MERNWYVICTQKKQEKKVAMLLAKKGIESFCPFTVTEIKNVSRSSKEYGPLFKSYVFVKASETDIGMIKKLPFVVNPLYWRTKPAIINADEINAIKMMVENYSYILLEKNNVKINENVGVQEKSITGFINNITSIKHQGITVTLPTLGFSLMAERQNARTAPVTEKKESFSSTIVKKLNPLMLFGL